LKSIRSSQTAPLWALVEGEILFVEVRGHITTLALDELVNIKRKILMIGRIYHVVDKTTGQVVKVGSTILTLDRRFNSVYRKKYNNHFF
jgi:hypothetical protein